MDNCTSPAIITKDLAMLVYGRDGRLGPRLKHLFQGTFRNPEANKLIGVYEITMKRLAIGSPGNIFISHLTYKMILHFVNGYKFYNVENLSVSVIN